MATIRVIARPAFVFIIGAAAVIKVAELGTVKLWLFEHRIYFVVDEAAPSCSRITGRDLRGVFLQVLLEVRRAFTASLVVSIQRAGWATGGKLYHGYSRAKR